MSTALIVGVDPHRDTFTAALLDERGKLVAHDAFDNRHAGFDEAVTWAESFGSPSRWGVENAAGLGQHLSRFLIDRGIDVRDVPPNKTNARGRNRHQGKSDPLDAHRVAQETQTNDGLANAFKRAQSLPPDTTREQLALWHNARKSLVRVRVSLLNEIDSMIQDLPEELRLSVKGIKSVRAKVNAIETLVRDTDAEDDVVLELRLELLAARIETLRDVIAQDKNAGKAITVLVAASTTSLCDIVGIAPRAAAELIITIGDVDRFTEAAFARYNGTAPVPASSGEGRGTPVRHRLSRGGNRQLNAAIHRIAMTQLRFEPRARALYDNARDRGHTKREALRILKRHLSNVIYRTMRRDARQNPRLT